MEDLPRPCNCTTGYCYRSLCPLKADRWNKPERQEPTYDRSKRQFTSWHKELTDGDK